MSYVMNFIMIGLLLREALDRLSVQCILSNAATQCIGQTIK